MGSTGDPPVPVGDPPTGTSQAAPRIRPSSLGGDVRPIPSGESPDGTGQWPVLPNSQFPNTLLAQAPPRNMAGGRILRSNSSRAEPRNRGEDALPRVQADRQVVCVQRGLRPQ